MSTHAVEWNKRKADRMVSIATDDLRRALNQDSDFRLHERCWRTRVRLATDCQTPRVKLVDGEVTYVDPGDTPIDAWDLQLVDWSTPSSAGELLATGVEGSQFVPMQGPGHSSMAENPERFEGIIVPILAVAALLDQRSVMKA